MRFVSSFHNTRRGLTCLFLALKKSIIKLVCSIRANSVTPHLRFSCLSVSEMFEKGIGHQNLRLHFFIKENCLFLSVIGARDYVAQSAFKFADLRNALDVTIACQFHLIHI